MLAKADGRPCRRPPPVPGFRSPHWRDSFASWPVSRRDPGPTEQAPRGKRDVRDTRSADESDRQPILIATIIGDALEFFDYFLIGFVLAFLIGPWKLTFGQSATVLMSSGIGAIMGAYV